MDVDRLPWTFDFLSQLMMEFLFLVQLFLGDGDNVHQATDFNLVCHKVSVAVG